MCESFKINVYFDEKGEELESLIEHLLIKLFLSSIGRRRNAWESKENNIQGCNIY